MDDHTTKYCPRCQQYKPISCFYKNKSRKDGLDGRCKDCDKAYRATIRPLHRERCREYRLRYPDRIKESQRLNDEKNHERNRQRKNDLARKRYADNPEKYRGVTKRKRVANPDTYRLSNKRTHEKYKEIINYKSRVRRRFKHEQNATYRHRRRARKLNLPNTLTAEEWTYCLDYFEHRCAVCGRPAGLWHKIAMDHWIPLTSPDCPGTVATNIVPLCHGIDGCNNHKRNKEPHAWLIEEVGERQANRIAQRVSNYFASLLVRSEK